MFDFLSALFGGVPGAANRLAQPANAQPGMPPMQPPVTIANAPQVAGIQPQQAQPPPAAVPGSLAPMMAPQQPQAAPAAQPRGFADRYKDFTSSDRGQALNDFFNGLAMGTTPQDSLSKAAVLVAQNSGSRRDRNDTVEWLKGRGVDESTAKQMAGNPRSLQEYLTNMLTPNKKSGLISAGGSLYDPENKQWITPPAGAARQTEYGLNLIYGKDPSTGRTVGYQLSKDGTYKPFEPPNGVELTPGVSQVDTGTGTALVNNKTGETVGQIDKDVSGAANQTATGKNVADATNALPGLETSASSTLATIDSLANDPYLPNMLGPVAGRMPNISGDSQRVQGKMDQVNGATFLQAFNSLRGGGAITEVEGQKGTQAIARLGTAQNEADYRQALTELRGIVQQGIANARKRAGVATPAPQSAAPPSVDDLLKKYGGQ